MFRSRTDIVRVEAKTKLTCGDELFGCEYCSEGGWSSETEVEIHKSLVHLKVFKEKLQNRKTVCSICIEEFRSNKDLVNHIKKVHLYSSKDAYRVEREIFVCNYCSDIFFNKSHLVVHITRRHSNDYDTKKVECPKCGLGIKCKQMWMHFQTHMAQSISACRFCFTKCKTRQELKHHLDTHGRYFKCDMCGYNSKKSELFNKHIKEKHKQKNVKTATTGTYKDYFIPRNSVIVGKGQIVSIYRGLSVGNGVKICILCREICVRRQHMKNHIMYDHFMQDVPLKYEYKCTCGIVYSNKVLLTHHIFKEKGNHRVYKENDLLQEKWERFVSVAH